MRRRFGCFRLIGQLILIIIGLIAAFLLGKSAVSGAQDLGARWQARSLHEQQVAVFPDTATLIAQLNQTVSYQQTHWPTATATPTDDPSVDMASTDDTTPSDTMTATAALIAPATTGSVDTASQAPSKQAIAPQVVAELPSATPLPSSTQLPTLTDTATASTVPSATLILTDTATTAPTFTSTPFATVVALLPSDTPTRVGPPATNTKRPSSTVVPASPTDTATNVPSDTATFTATTPPTSTPSAVPTATFTQTPTVVQPTATDQPTIAATNKLPVVTTRTECTTKPQPTAIPTPYPRFKVANNDILNIALLGTDADVEASDKYFNTDTIVIVSINRTTNTVAMLSIPRDLIVCIPGLGMRRVNTAYIWGETNNYKPGGGFGLFQETILYNFGIPVHYYAKVSLIGFKSIVDAVGGVDIAVDCPIRDELRFQGNNDQGTPVYAPASAEVGFYHMNGSMALWYARARHNTSDFDRNRRQQQVLRAIYRTAREQGLVNKAAELWGQLTKIVDTNMQLPDVLGLVPLALNLKPDDITTYYMYKGYQTDHWAFAENGVNQDVQIPLEPGFSETLRNFYTPPTKNKIREEAVTVDILNGSGKDDWDKVAMEALLNKGFQANAKGKTDTAAKTVIFDYTGGAKKISLAALLKTLNVRADVVVSQADPNRTVDFKVVLGANYNSCSAPGFNIK